MKLLSVLAATAAITGAFAATTVAGAVDLTGQSATAVFDTTTGGAISNQFVSPALIGAGVEFTGDFTDVFNQNWVLGLDFDTHGFTLTMDETANNGNGNVQSTSALNISISGLSGLEPVVLESYSCVSPGFSCGAFEWGPSITTLTSTASTVFLDLRTIRDGETYVFAFGRDEVPAPAALALFGLGALALGLRRR